MENEDTKTLEVRVQATSVVSKVITPKHLETHFDKCLYCDKYGYEILMPEKMCLTCMENYGINRIFMEHEERRLLLKE